MYVSVQAQALIKWNIRTNDKSHRLMTHISHTVSCLTFSHVSHSLISCLTFSHIEALFATPHLQSDHQ